MRFVHSVALRFNFIGEIRNNNETGKGLLVALMLIYAYRYLKSKHLQEATQSFGLLINYYYSSPYCSTAAKL